MLKHRENELLEELELCYSELLNLDPKDKTGNCQQWSERLRIVKHKKVDIIKLKDRYETLKDLETTYIKLIDIERRSIELNIKPTYLNLYKKRLITIQNELKILRKVINYDTK